MKCYYHKIDLDGKCSAAIGSIDVSKIVVKHGGGGHAGAAGFISDKYLLKDV